MAGSMRDRRCFLGMLACLGLSAGCATVLGPSKHDIRVRSDPSGAHVWVNGANQGSTPTVARVPAGNDARVVVALNGKRRECAVAYQLSGGWLVADLVFGLLPLLVDAATGAWYQPSSRECAVYFNFAEKSDAPGRQGKRQPAPKTPSFNPTEAAELCQKGVERYCAKPTFNQAEAVELCNKGVEQSCRMLLEHDSKGDAPETSTEGAGSPEEPDREPPPPSRRVFRPSPSPAPVPRE